MVKKVNGLLKALMWITALATSLVIPGLFWTGATMNYPILSILPLVFHQGVALVIYVTVIWEVIRRIM